jgi:hypothetical protein
MSGEKRMTGGLIFELLMVVRFISHMNYVKKLPIFRNTLGTNLNLEAHKAVMQHQHETRYYTHVNGGAIVKHSMFLK